MISNQILQNTIEGLKGISKVDFCVLDTEGKELAATGEVDKNCSDAGSGRWITSCSPSALHRPGTNRRPMWPGAIRWSAIPGAASCTSAERGRSWL